MQKISKRKGASSDKPEGFFSGYSLSQPSLEKPEARDRGEGE
jgi:hypothetical protein